MKRGDGTAILLHDPERRVVTLVRQFRYPTWEKGPGWTVELPRMRVAEGGGLTREGEDIEIVEMSEHDVWRALDDHDIIDAKTLVGLQWLRQRRLS